MNLIIALCIMGTVWAIYSIGRTHGEIAGAMNAESRVKKQKPVVKHFRRPLNHNGKKLPPANVSRYFMRDQQDRQLAQIDINHN